MKIAENITPEELELIEAFLCEEETPVQKVAFSEKMQSDADWDNKINTIRLLKAGISEAALKQKLNAFHNDAELSDQNKTIVKKMFSPQKMWWAAASIIILAFVGFFLFKNDKYENAYANYYKPDPGLITVMGIADNYEFEEGMVQYKNGKYAKALQLWNKPLKSAPHNDTILYFTAAAQQALKQDAKATRNYLKVLQQPNSLFYKDANWYLGLIYLESKQKEKAKPLLINSGREEVNELLKKIN